MRIGIDLLGSDTSPHLLFEGVLQAALQFAPSHLFLVIATPQLISEFSLRSQKKSPESATIDYFSVTDEITMRDEPLTAIRQKKNSSLIVGLRLLKKGKIDGLISAGNTGALIAGASLHLPKVPDVRRPALLAMLPTAKGFTAVIDVGGNVSCKAPHLVQFAKMGAAVQRCSRSMEYPTVGLLNIGVESKKGTSDLRQAYQILEQTQESLRMKFVGNIEGREVLQGKVDVLVTDGFTGNVLLKTIEGTSAFILESMGKMCPSENSETLARAMKELKSHFNYHEYPGAIVCGIDRLLIKCHGNSSPTSFYHGICGLATLIENHLLQQFKEQLTVS